MQLIFREEGFLSLEAVQAYLQKLTDEYYIYQFQILDSVAYDGEVFAVMVVVEPLPPQTFRWDVVKSFEVNNEQS